MERKKKSVKHKKSEIEKQYEEFFHYVPRTPPIQQLVPTEDRVRYGVQLESTPPIQQLVPKEDRVRYGVGQFEIPGVKII